MTDLLEEATKLGQYFIIMPIPKPGIKIGNKFYNGKEANIKEWSKMTKRATAPQLESWFNGKHENNIAIILRTNGFVIDCDGQNCKSILWTKVIPTLSIDLQEAITRTARTGTGGGGEHFIFGIRQEDFPNGIRSKPYLKLGEHEEIAIKGNGGYAVERGIHESGNKYLAVRGIENLVVLTKYEVEELLSALDKLKSKPREKEQFNQQQEQEQEQEQRQDQDQDQDQQIKTYNLDDTKISSIVKELEPLYKIGSRDEITFSLGGCLHKWQVNEDSTINIINRLACDASDEEQESRIQTIKITYSKNRGSSEVSGRNRFVDALTLVTNDKQKADSIVKKIGRVVTEARNEQGEDLETETYKEVADIGKQIPQEILTQLGNDVYKIVNYDPTVFIIAHEGTKQIIRAVVKKSQHENKDNVIISYNLVWKNAIIDAIPIKVVKNDNPLDGTITYKITFAYQGSNKPFTIGAGTIGHITDELQNRARLLKKAEAADALTAILIKYENMEIAEINDKIPTPGYYWIDGKIVGYDIVQNLDLDPEHDKAHKDEVLECIEVIEGLYRRNKNKSVFSTVLKWSTVAPFSYVKKCIDTSDSNWLPYLQAYGWTRTGKNTMGKIALAVCRKLTKKDAQEHIIGFGNVNTDARLGRAMGLSTYPKLVNEVGALTSEKYIPIVELIKHAAESLTVRGGFKGNSRYGNESALCPLILTSNLPPPTDSAYRIRVVPLRFDKIHETSDQEKEEFNKWAYEDGNIYKLGILGDFTAKYIMANPTILKNSWDEIGKIILSMFFDIVGIQAPDWIDLLEKENVIEQSNDETYFGLRGFLEQAVIEGYRKDFRIDPNGMAITFETRLSHCLQYRTIPYLLEHSPKGNTEKEVVITWNIIPELLKHKIPNISTLVGLAAEIPGFKYRLVKINGQPKKVVSGKYGDFRKFLNCSIGEDDQPNIEQ